MRHQIAADILNTNIEYCIDQYVRLYEHRDMLREKWFEGKTLEELAGEHNMSLTMVKKIIYGIGDDVLIRAAKMN